MRAAVWAWTCLLVQVLVQGVLGQVTAGSDVGFTAVGIVVAPATRNNKTDPLSGGTVNINGRTIIIPDNTVCTLPANTGATSISLVGGHAASCAVKFPC
jgi:hypothetical protein